MKTTADNTTDPATSYVIARAFAACAAIQCPKCGVDAWQHCRNRTAGTLFNAPFHKPRQVAAGAPEILSEVGIRHLRWQPAVGQTAWDGKRMQEF
ncbi:hypothetical protein AB0D22_07605 [Kitasatospora sp. NPDC048538]|uniref:zinc finger domain-containing protein n=1 Tax=Kitasatospora sp. NPDC048538 TaxID=3155633 RepID=UPI0033DB5AD4